MSKPDALPVRQRDRGVMSYPSAGWHAMLFKAPVVLWRLGLGPVVGRVLMIVTTTGRKSGEPRRTMVEYYRVAGVPYAVAAFGKRAQWYRNVLADPRVTVQTAAGVQPSVATRVQDAAELLAAYRAFKRHDQPLLSRYLATLSIADDPDDVLRKKERIHLLRFDPTDQPTPPPLPADLRWVWAAAVLLVVGVAWRAARFA